jgi:hypothetical protein
VAVNAVVEPEQMVTSDPALATGNGFTVTITLSEAVPQELVAVTVKVLVITGLTVMLDVVAPVFHKYVVPPEADNVVEVPEQIVTSEPAFAVGKAVTVTTTLSLAVPQLLVAVTVYVVVAPGFATGLLIFVELKPADGDHK